MELYKIAAIARTIYGKIVAIDTESCRAEWQYSLYYAINMAVNNVGIELEWEDNHAQWNINHLFRGKKINLQTNHPSLNVRIESIKATDNGIRISVVFEQIGLEDAAFAITLNENNFIPLEAVHLNGKRILFDAERHDILDSILELEEVAEPAEVRQPGDKLRSMIEMLGPLREVYGRQNQTGKNYIETVVGASIFYLPHPVNECFSGYCSVNALNEKINCRSIVKEHIIPRKYAAREILNEDYDLNNFHGDFLERFRRFMYLTTEENKKTVNYTEVTHDEALNNLDIIKFPVSNSPFVNNHTLFMNFIAYCKTHRRENEALTLELAMTLLGVFPHRDQD